METLTDTRTMDLKVRNVPPALGKRLRILAFAEDTSMNSLIIAVLQKYADAHPVRLNGLPKK